MTRPESSWCQRTTRDGEQCLAYACGVFALKDDQVGVRLCRAHFLQARRKDLKPERIAR